MAASMTQRSSTAVAPDSGPLQPVPWQARVEGRVEGSEVGLTPLLLPVQEARPYKLA